MTSKPATKATRTYFEYKLTVPDRKKVIDVINAEFDRYLEHSQASISKVDREHLRRQAVYQLSEFMSELADGRGRWSLDSTVITVRLQTKLVNVSRRGLESLPKSDRNNYRFIQKSNKWEMKYDPGSKKGFSYDEFNKEIYNKMYESASTAAFYSIESWFR